MLNVRNIHGTVTLGVLAAAGAIVWTAALGLAQQSSPAPVPPILQNYKTVTAERLKKPEDGDWLMVRRTYDGWGYSPLDQITPGNVARLRPVWIFATGVTSGHEAAPIVNNGVMFVATPGNQVIAIDARTGGLLWRYRRPLPEDLLQPHRTSRGVALSGDKVFFAAAEAVLVALDARTGKEVWTAKVAENRAGYYMSLAPLVVGAKVLVGTSGGDIKIRGFVAAYDIDTGKEV
jgi:alcohol dehydrogenase (cytochrome c)